MRNRRVRAGRGYAAGQYITDRYTTGGVYNRRVSMKKGPSIKNWTGPLVASCDYKITWDTRNHRIAMHTKSMMNSAATIQMIGWTSLALPLQVFTRQYMMKPPAMP